MIKLKPKKLSFLTFAFVLTFSTLTFLFSEKIKNQKKMQELQNYYAETYKNWDDYQKEYWAQVDELREQNLKDMVEIEKNYNSLLAQQPSIISEHTRVVENTTYVAQNTTTSTNSGSTTSKQTISVPKLQTSTKTGAS